MLIKMQFAVIYAPNTAALPIDQNRRMERETRKLY